MLLARPLSLLLDVLKYYLKRGYKSMKSVIRDYTKMSWYSNRKTVIRALFCTALAHLHARCCPFRRCPCKVHVQSSPFTVTVTVTVPSTCPNRQESFLPHPCRYNLIVPCAVDPGLLKCILAKHPQCSNKAHLPANRALSPLFSRPFNADPLARSLTLVSARSPKPPTTNCLPSGEQKRKNTNHTGTGFWSE